MEQALMVACVKRMLVEADRRTRDAQRLRDGDFGISDSAYLLDLLGFEILLKTVVLIHGGNTHGHKYGQLFRSLPTSLQDRLIHLAKHRESLADYHSLDPLLDDLTSNFVGLRYPYEKYDGLTEEEYRRLGDEWTEARAPLDQATFRYHPFELRGLVHGLRDVLHGWLST